MNAGKDQGKDGERSKDLKDTGKGKEPKGNDESTETKGKEAKVVTPDPNASKGNDDEGDQDTTNAPRKRRVKTPAEKAAHARYMRFSRSLDSSFLRLWAMYVLSSNMCVF